MVLEYLPSLGPFLGQMHVGKYSIHYIHYMEHLGIILRPYCLGKPLWLPYPTVASAVGGRRETASLETLAAGKSAITWGSWSHQEVIAAQEP